MNNHTINIAIIDDDKLVVKILNGVLQRQDNFTVVAKAFSGNSFLRQLEEIEIIPDIVLLDIRMKDGDGLEVIDAVTKKYPQLKIIVLTSYYKASSTGYMLKLGVSAFLPKEIDKEELLEVIQKVYTKGHFFTSEQIHILRSQTDFQTPKITNLKESFSSRELEVLEIICQKYTSREIADNLFLSFKTIEAHRTNMISKTNSKNTAGLIMYALENKLIDPNDMKPLN